MNRIYKTNALALQYAREEIEEETVRRLKALGNSESPWIDDPCSFWNMGHHDPVLPFEKDEPHPLRKAVNGKWRIVNALSLVDQLVERVLFEKPLKLVKAMYPESDAVIGIGFSDPQADSFCEEVISTFPSRFWSTDISGWDRSLDRTYIVAASKEVLNPMRNGEKCSSHKLAIERHAMMLTNPLFLLPSDDEGYELVKRAHPGGMLSGSFMTTLYNTMCRVDVAYLAGAVRVKAAGDDALEAHEVSYKDVQDSYSKLGFNLRQPEEVGGNSLTFCSHNFSKEIGGWKADLQSWPKALYSALSKKLTPERESAFVQEMGHNDRATELIGVLKTYAVKGPELKAVQGLDSI